MLLNGYFVAVEFAAVSARTSRLEQDAERNLFARLGLEIKKKLDLYLSSCQLGVTLASLALGAVTEPAVASLLQRPLEWLHVPHDQIHRISFIVAFAVSTSLHIVVGEQAPKNWSIQFADRVLPMLSAPLVALHAQKLLELMCNHDDIPRPGKTSGGNTLPPVPRRDPQDLALDADEKLWAKWHGENGKALRQAWSVWWEKNKNSVKVE